MKKMVLATVVASLMAVCGFAAATKGAEVGTWTMDVPAALELAAKTQKPVFLCFTGSDWCGWCKLMEKNVFSKPAWQAYAKESVVMVWLDFPRDEKLVPEEFRARNAELAKQYGVEGFPTYVILSPTGEELGRLGADQKATPEKFIEQLEEVLVLKDLSTLLSAEDWAAYQALETKQAELKRKSEAWEARVRKEGKAFMVAFEDIKGQQAALKQKALETARRKK